MFYFQRISVIMTSVSARLHKIKDEQLLRKLLVMTCVLVTYILAWITHSPFNDAKYSYDDVTTLGCAFSLWNLGIEIGENLNSTLSMSCATVF